MSLERLFMTVRSEVPACVPLMPLFAMSPIACAVSSAENPSAPAIGAQYLKVSPIMDTLVLALELAAARMSEKCPASDAFSPKAVSASVTMSDATARSSPDAAARLIMPSIPSIISPLFQPAIAIYSKAEAASEAENFVLAPISRALSRRVCNSSPVAPEMAETRLMPSSNSAVVLTAAAPTPAMASVTGIIFLPAPAMESPTFCILPPMASIFARAVLVLAASRCNRCSSCSVSTISRCKASYLS